jgi:hypothetical protein
LALDEGDPRIVIVKIPELTEIGRIDGLRFAPRALRFSHSGKLLAASARDTSVVIYDLEKSMSKH